MKVVAIGGGTGLSTLLRGLKRYVVTPASTFQAQPAVTRLTAVVTVTDEGGSSGRLRREFRMLPPGDIRNCLVALAEDALASGDESLMGEPFRVRRQALSELVTEKHWCHVTRTTEDPAVGEHWLTTFEGAGLDGVVAKRLDAAYQPGKRAMLKITRIVREEMDKIAQEFYLPALNQRAIWAASGRWFRRRGRRVVA